MESINDIFKSTESITLNRNYLFKPTKLTITFRWDWLLKIVGIYTISKIKILSGPLLYKDKRFANWVYKCKLLNRSYYIFWIKVYSIDYNSDTKPNILYY